MAEQLLEGLNDNNKDWFDLAASCLSDSKWEIAAKRPDASLSHRSCPWGGHLIRFDNRRLFVQHAPENPRNFFVRPEVRGLYEGGSSEIRVQCRGTLAPGEALLERSSSMWVFKMASVLFGNFQGLSSFFYDNLPAIARHQLRRDFPEAGDCAYVGQECLLISRRESGTTPRATRRFRVVLVFRTPEDRWAHWAWPLFPMITDMFYKAMMRFLNRPEIKEMQQVDANLYMVLCMRSFNRGPPMIPNAGGPGAIIISSGQELGLKSWSRFRGDERKGFSLAQYLKSFMEKMGHDLTTYETLDGCRLVPYQCVVKRSDWERMRDSFGEGFRLQKAAYRRANGGTTAPALVEDVNPHWSSQGHCGPEPEDSQEVVVKTVVRKTFLELEEDVNESDGLPMRRTKSEVSAVM